MSEQNDMWPNEMQRNLVVLIKPEKVDTITLVSWQVDNLSRATPACVVLSVWILVEVDLITDLKLLTLGDSGFLVGNSLEARRQNLLLQIANREEQ